MKQKVCKFISILTVAPLVALFLLTAIYLYDSSVFVNIKWYLFSIFFLTLVPISAYGIKNAIPSIKKQGRNGERKLAFIMCVVGYILGAVLSFVLNAPLGVKIIFLGYLISGVLLAFINSVIKLKASGHACGISGPCILSLFFFGLKSWYMPFLLIPVFWARLNMGRHTVKELVFGTLTGIVSTCIAIFIFI